MKTSYSVIGGMAGSSLDGLDLAHILFFLEGGKWQYEIKKSETIPYENEIHQRLKDSSNIEIEDQKRLDIDFGHWIGRQVGAFTSEIDSLDFAAIHGHTVVHKPVEGISWQLGRGDVIAQSIQIPTITDFRSEDVRLGGQGAPLVPFGDYELFQSFDACINLGGIANISLRSNRTAWDICPCNQVLNHFANQLGRPYDDQGQLALKGTLNEHFYQSISSDPYFVKPPPKSLPNNHFDLEYSIDPYIGLYTYCQFIAEQTGRDINEVRPGKMLLTGGGALNTFLVDQIKQALRDWEITVPEHTIIHFKEALVFAFLGLMRMRNEINTLASVTGASKDSSSGVIHLPE